MPRPEDTQPTQAPFGTPDEVPRDSRRSETQGQAQSSTDSNGDHMYAPPGDGENRAPEPNTRRQYQWKKPPKSADDVIAAIDQEVSHLERRIAEITAELAFRPGDLPPTVAQSLANQPLRKELLKLQIEARARVRAILAIPEAERTRRITIKGTLPRSLANVANVATQFVETYTAAELMPIIEVLELPPGEDREHHDRGKVFFSPNTPAGFAVHEIAHAIEAQNPRVLAACKAFLARRCAGEKPRRLSEITGDSRYRSDEIAYEDKWVERGGDIYTGKVQPHATEILTTGSERLHKDPLQFLRQDPEFFSFVVNTLRNW